ncbi:dihydroxyacetone kinase subunit DhaL [Cellulomonas bogoriensis]|uniref:Dihydroxyacetone kinase n=1 Tax=Cellulomonas bogoriensis 69B4 = DSM 16987 TaxID=1386082 RepID=A0A0A0BWT7_9CELL|nr:dihydroxyacetone kinase subunit DhaL [Cellulomonas bogoriensis]KGM12843.1 dihydroxyacetone kinase [Cellulomonas bogoriensis 69B4 = DSM 16987]
MALDAAWAVRWARWSAEVVVAEREHLVELDRRIGDGDHGENLARGLSAVQVKLGQVPVPDQVGEVLRLVATTMMSTVGGAAGPLYGTAFLRAAKISGVSSLSPAAVVAMLEAALEGVVSRGRASPGEKTMVDAWAAAVGAAQEAEGAGADPVAVLAAAADAAEAGARSTVPMVATKGRASYLGERSAGHMDPGAASTAMLLRAAHAAAESS